MSKTDEFYATRRTRPTPAEQMGWGSTTVQHSGFSALLSLTASALPLAGLRVHDAGCGYGEFYPLVKKHGIDFYIGTDCMMDAVLHASATYPDATFRATDLLVDELPAVDVTFVNGTLAYHSPADMVVMLSRLYESSAKALAFRCWWGNGWPEIRQAVAKFMHSVDAHRFSRVGDYGLWYEGAFVLLKP